MAQREPKGNSQEWNNIWSEYGAGAAPHSAPQLFVRGQPRTLLQFWQRCYFEDLKRLYPEPWDGKRFLELGSGRGTLSMYLASEGASDITLVDLSQSAFQLVRENFQREGLQIPNLVCADAERTSLPDASFDCIYNVGLLEHFEDPGPVIRETYRLLKPGGVTYQPIVPEVDMRLAFLCLLLFKPISLPKQILRLLRGKRTSTPEVGMVRTQIGRAAYLRLAEDAGFVDAQCIPYNPYWKVNREGWFEREVTLRGYALHHSWKRRFSSPHTPLLKTSSLFQFCYLLTGRKR